MPVNQIAPRGRVASFDAASSSRWGIRLRLLCTVTGQTSRTATRAQRHTVYFFGHRRSTCRSRHTGRTIHPDTIAIFSARVKRPVIYRSPGDTLLRCAAGLTPRLRSDVSLR